MTDWYRTFTRVSALSILLVAIPAMAQDFPSRPVTIVTPQPPGASSDLLARTVGDRLSHAWGQSVIVDNRPGASGNVGAAFVARAPADGYTLMVGTDAMLTSNVYLFKNMPFDPVKDFAPITNGGANIICLAVNTQLPVDLGAGADRLCQGESRQAAIRLVRHRLAASSLRRAAGAEDRHPDRSRAVSRRRPGGERSSRRPHQHGLSQPVLGGAAAHQRQDQDPRGGREDPLRGHARHADHRRDRPRLRDVVVARLLRAGRHAGAAGRAAQRGDHQGAHDRRGEGEARHSRSRGRAQHARPSSPP